LTSFVLMMNVSLHQRIIIESIILVPSIAVMVHATGKPGGSWRRRLALTPLGAHFDSHVHGALKIQDENAHQWYSMAGMPETENNFVSVSMAPNKLEERIIPIPCSTF
jgi:hypothetical protein